MSRLDEPELRRRYREAFDRVSPRDEAVERAMAAVAAAPETVRHPLLAPAAAVAIAMAVVVTMLLGGHSVRLTPSVIQPDGRVANPGVPTAGESQPPPPPVAWDERPGSLSRVTFDPVEGRIGLAGGGGVMVRSPDRGQSWTQVYAGPAVVRDLLWLDGHAVLAATSRGLMRSDDAGLTWTVIGSRTDLLRLDFLNLSVGYAVAGSSLASGQLVKTTDGGATYRPVDSPTRPVHWIQFVDERRGWLAGPAGIWTTGDGGSTWERQRSFEPGTFGDSWLAQIGMRDQLHGFAYYRSTATGMNQAAGVLFHTADGGKTWRLVSATSYPTTPLSGQAPNHSLPGSPTGELVVTGPASAKLLGWLPASDRTYIYSTTDGGGSWTSSQVTSLKGARGQLAWLPVGEWMAVTDFAGNAYIGVRGGGEADFKLIQVGG
jgi:photosystem II stability/assembly factor-like uncharacterized protein